MKLIIFTQKVDMNDPVLGFFHNWLFEFAKNTEFVTAVCLGKGEYNLPSNVKVVSLGKESGGNRFSYLARFYKTLWQERNNYDTVFVHMNQIYVILGGIIWKIIGRKIALWYTHRQVSTSLKIAEKFADVIFSATKESFKLRSNKVHFVGHGIVLSDFVCENRTTNSGVEIVSVGRITPIKNIDVLVRAAQILKDTWNKTFKITLVGSPATGDDFMHLDQLKELIKEHNLENHICFVSSVSNSEIKKFYCSSDLLINLSPTGGLDKVVLESIASKTPAIVANKAFKGVLGTYVDILLVEENNEKDLALKIMNLFENPNRPEIIKYLYNNVVQDFELKNLIPKILLIINETGR